MRKFLNLVAKVWGGVAFAGLLLGWWAFGPFIGQLVLALVLYIATTERKLKGLE